MEGPVEEGVIKKQTAALRPALWLSTNYKLTRRGHSETCQTKKEKFIHVSLWDLQNKLILKHFVLLTDLPGDISQTKCSVITLQKILPTQQ